jgi:predicted amidophosphoribosyltransferase
MMGIVVCIALTAAGTVINLVVAVRALGARRRARARRAGLCAGCGYNLSHLEGSPVCPECGLPRDGHRRATAA